MRLIVNLIVLQLPLQSAYSARRTEPVFSPQTWPHMRFSYINPNVTFANAVKNDDPKTLINCHLNKKATKAANLNRL